MLTLTLLLLSLLTLAALVRPMSDATATKKWKTQPRAGVGAYPVASGVTVHPGMLCQLEGGYLNHWDETGQFLGIVLGDAQGVAPGAAVTGTASGSVYARVDQSGVTLMHIAVGGTPAATDVGALVYCNDSDVANITKTDTTDPPVGILVAFRSTSDCDVMLFTPTEHAAGIANATWLS